MPLSVGMVLWDILLGQKLVTCRTAFSFHLVLMVAAGYPTLSIFVNTQWLSIC